MNIDQFEQTIKQKSTKELFDLLRDYIPFLNSPYYWEPDAEDKIDMLIDALELRFNTKE